MLYGVLYELLSTTVQTMMVSYVVSALDNDNTNEENSATAVAPFFTLVALLLPAVRFGIFKIEAFHEFLSSSIIMLQMLQHVGTLLHFKFVFNRQSVK